MGVTNDTSDPPQGDVRERRRLALMRRAQTAALDLFEARGFDRVTVEEIAALCDVSPPTIYRHFGTKEQLVFWDEYDPVIFGVLAQSLRTLPVLDALRAAVLVPLDRVYASDAKRILRRVRLVQKEPSLRAVRASSMHAFRSALAGVFVSARACRDAMQAEVLAGAFAVALEAAIEHWAATDGATPLRRFIERALRDLVALGKHTQKTARGTGREGRPRHG
jgi:AcrR family transcriptional regulator